MNTITAPRAIKKGEEFVIIPRKEYEEFLRAHKMNGKKYENIVVKHKIKVPKRHKKFYEELDKELTESLREYYAGKSYGPFDSINKLKMAA